MQLAHGGGGCSHDTTLAALTQGAWRRSEPSGAAVRRRPATGNRTPTPSEHARQGSPAGGQPPLRSVGIFVGTILARGET